ncbi:tubulin-like doman-containing protein [Azospirillum lipoferum]|uniref:Tubulin like n=1 Tax=Azospirillum lipoferum (strain 4B) TaxID=862719 RepID=G7Z9H4_AZOL4|nr:tubulin-like doman-containing protein [Azospirillum lipoferum]CBS86078.1 Conserved protein of unknown function [Azospirillum lipoferum 4B]
MTKCYFIGVGGTGARCGEAMLHLCAAGLGPEELWMGFVDPDSSNGNLERTKDLLKLYQVTRATLRNPGNSQLSPKAPLFRTSVQTAVSGASWSQVPAGITSMRDLFHHSRMEDDGRDLFDALYLREEQEMDLSHGFRARPAIGAAVIGARVESDDEFWQDVFAAQQDANQNRDVRIFLVGSVFGGTGASGFPVIARRLREALNSPRVTISGALALPYFSYAPPTDSGAIIAHSGAFIHQSRGALEHYQDLLSKPGPAGPAFDNLFMFGWPRLLPLPASRTGGRAQCNPPLLPELYGALAAAGFFHGGAIPNAKVLHIARNAAPTLTWDDLPAIASPPGASSDVKAALGGLLRFAVAFRAIYAPLLDRSVHWRYERHSWYRRLLADTHAQLDGDSAQLARTKLDSYCHAFLRWMVTLVRCSSHDGLAVDLFNDNAVGADGVPDERGLLALQDELFGRAKPVFADLVTDSVPGTASFDRILDNLNAAVPPAGSEGLSAFVEALFDQCRLGDGKPLIRPT